MESLYEYLEVDETVQGWLEEIRQLDAETVLRRTLSWIKEKIDSVTLDVVTWEPSQGEFEVRVTLPFNMKDLQSLPYFEVPDYFGQATSVYNNHMPSLKIPDWSIWDTVYEYKPVSWNPAQWLPPYSAHATIFGNSHFMTFDGQFYDFAGEDCDYLLARDLADGKFSLLVNYENAQRNSVSLISGNNEIRIFNDLRVTIDGNDAELPFDTSLITVRRVDNSVQVDINEFGLKLTCENEYNTCSLYMNGWFHGKTAGLFGTYDNEGYNDITTVEGLLAGSIEMFADSWKVGDACVSRNTAHTQQSTLDEAGYEACAKYFEKSTSPLRPCFSQVNTSAFMGMCLTDVSRGEIDNVVCNIAAHFIDQCAQNGVYLPTPSECVSCDLIGVSDEHMTEEADVVFVVSEKECNEDIITHLPTIASQIKVNYRSAGINDVQFGLVGYGGEGLLFNPHSYTLDSSLIGLKSSLVKTLQSFRTTPGDSENTLEAINFAADYPFRPHANKTIIVIPCQSCHEDTIDYTTVTNNLLKRGLSLHALIKHNFQLNTDAPKTSYIFGADRYGLFTPKHVGDERPISDSELKAMVNLPQDTCAYISQSTGGATFNVGQLLNNRPAMQRRFLDVFSRVLTKDSAESTCLQCECTAEGKGKTTCSKCDYTPISRTWVGGYF